MSALLPALRGTNPRASQGITRGAQHITVNCTPAVLIRRRLTAASAASPKPSATQASTAAPVCYTVTGPHAARRGCSGGCCCGAPRPHHCAAAFVAAQQLTLPLTPQRSYSGGTAAKDTLLSC